MKYCDFCPLNGPCIGMDETSDEERLELAVRLLVKLEGF